VRVLVLGLLAVAGCATTTSATQTPFPPGVSGDRPGTEDLQASAESASAGTEERPSESDIESGQPVDGPGDGGGITPAEAAAEPADALGTLASLATIVADTPPSFWSWPRNLQDVPSSSKPRRGRRGKPYHPASRIVVDVLEADAADSAVSLQRTARDLGYWPFRRCYEEGLRRDRRLHGTVWLRLHVAPGGHVDSVHVVSKALAYDGYDGGPDAVENPPLSDRAGSACIARETASLSFAGIDVATNATMAVVLTPGDRPIPVPMALPESQTLREALRSFWPDAQRCYLHGLARNRELGGALELRLRVGPDGRIVEATEDGTEFGDADVARCVSEVYARASLPRAPSASDSSFFYELDFEPDLTPSEQEPP